MSDYKLQFDEHGYGGIHGPSLEAVTERVAKTIAEDFDGKTRAALIELGWVPPDQVAAARSAALEEAAAEMEHREQVARTASANFTVLGHVQDAARHEHYRVAYSSGAAAIRALEA